MLWTHSRNLLYMFLSSNMATWGFILMACKKKIMSYSVSKLRELSILMKTPFHINKLLHNVLMPFYVESDSHNHPGVGIFSHKETLEKLCVFVFLCELKENFIDMFWQLHFFFWWLKKNLSHQVVSAKKKLILDPGSTAIPSGLNASPSKVVF